MICDSVLWMLQFSGQHRLITARVTSRSIAAILRPCFDWDGCSNASAHRLVTSIDRDAPSADCSFVSIIPPDSQLSSPPFFALISTNLFLSVFRLRRSCKEQPFFIGCLLYFDLILRILMMEYLNVYRWRDGVIVGSRKNARKCWEDARSCFQFARRWLAERWRVTSRWSADVIAPIKCA